MARKKRQAVNRRASSPDSTSQYSTRETASASVPRHYSMPDPSPNESVAFRNGQYHHRHPMANTKALVKYNGTDKPLTARTWMTMYERHAMRLDCNEEDKLLYIDTFLEGDAITWFATEITANPDRTWEELRESFFHRFDNSNDEPLTRLVDFKLTKDMTVASYYQEMMRIAQPIGLKPQFMIEALNLGLPAYYRSHIKAARPISYGQWLDIATSWERECKRQMASRNPFSVASELTKDAKNRSYVPKGITQAVSSGKKAPNPCYICSKYYGKPAEHHWSRDCPNRRQANVGDQGKEESSPEED